MAAAQLSGDRPVKVEAGNVRLDGVLTVRPGARGLVVFAHGGGSSRNNPRSETVASFFHGRSFATLLFDLLTPREESLDEQAGRMRFDIGLLAQRLTDATDWLKTVREISRFDVGLFGASTGAAAALRTAAARPQVVRAVVSRGGRPDLAGAALPRVQAPTLLIVGGDDAAVVALNRQALAKMRAETRLEIIPGATHLFEEPGTLQSVARCAADWFGQHLQADGFTTV